MSSLTGVAWIFSSFRSTNARRKSASVSRPLKTALDEAARLSDAGHPEIVICGVNLGLYGKDLGMDGGVVCLLEALLDVSGTTRFRLSSIAVTDVSSDLLALMASTSRICSHLHIPLQSGDEGVLKAMGRSYTPTGPNYNLHNSLPRGRDIDQGSPCNP